jgi:hypothetical protein
LYLTFSPILYSSQNPKNSETENDKIVPKSTVSIPETEELIAPGTPIQFDIVLPATEFLDQNRGSRYARRAVIAERSQSRFGTFYVPTHQSPMPC